MIKALGLMLLTVLLVWGCETTNSGSDVVGRAATCAMCGATVGGDYFYDTVDRSMGPTNR